MNKNKQWLNSENNIHVVPKTIHGNPKYISADTGFGLQLGHDADSQFAAVELKGEDGHEFSIMLHLMCMNPQKGKDTSYPIALSIISMTDFTNNTYCAQEDSFTIPDFTLSKDSMDVKTPISYIRGNKEHLEMGADLPNGIG